MIISRLEILVHLLKVGVKSLSSLFSSHTFPCSFGLYSKLASGQLTFQLLHSTFALLLFQELLRVHRVHHLWRIFLFHTLDVRILKCQPTNGTNIISKTLKCSMFPTLIPQILPNVRVERLCALNLPIEMSSHLLHDSMHIAFLRLQSAHCTYSYASYLGTYFQSSRISLK